MPVLIRSETHDWLAQVYHALVRNDNIMMVCEDTRDCGIAVAPADGESHQHFLAHGFARHSSMPRLDAFRFSARHVANAT